MWVARVRGIVCGVLCFLDFYTLVWVEVSIVRIELKRNETKRNELKIFFGELAKVKKVDKSELKRSGRVRSSTPTKRRRHGGSEDCGRWQGARARERC